jgi:capsular exopolysaccharide synthesis family protein
MKERELVEINRQKAIKDNLFNYLLQKREEAALSYAPTEEESRIVDSAHATIYPVSPKKILIYLMALFLASGLGVVYVTIKEVLSNKILFRSQLENFSSIPVLGELPFVETEKDNLIPINKEALPLIEEMRQLSAKLGLYSRVLKNKKILVTSNIPGEGKSFVSTNLANTLARAGKKTVLLDMDFKNPRITQFFNHKDKTGIINFLEGTAEMENILTIIPDNTNLFFASAGTNGGDHTKLLLNGKLEEFFEYLEDRFEFIVIDSAPISLVSDVSLFDEFSDETLLVIRHGYTPKLLIQRLDKVIKSKSLHNVSLVYNGVKRRGMVNSSYNYGYGYGNTYGYGGKYSMSSSK